MIATYRNVLTKPGAWHFATAGLLSRLPASMLNMSLILMIQIQYQSWEMAGRVAAIGVIVWAAQTVPTARLVDRYGQRRVMWPLAAIVTTGVIVVIFAGMNLWPEPILWAGVVLASISGPLGALTRARWTHLLDDEKDIHTAFALEGSLDEILFIGGPALATVLAYSVHPASGLILCTGAMLIGLALLLSQTATEPPPRLDAKANSLGWRVPKAILAVSLTAMGLGAVFGALDISVVAKAEEAGHEALGGVVLAIISLGSLVGGLAYGARQWRSALWKRFILFALILALGFSILVKIPGLLWFTIFGFVVGIAIAPLITSQDTVTQRVVRPDQITEGMSWLRIGLGAGVAAGAWLGGRLIDQGGSAGGLTVTAGAAMVVAAVALLTIPWVKQGTQREFER